MKKYFIFAALAFSLPALADFVSDHESLFRNQSLCYAEDSEQVGADASFKAMFETLKEDHALGNDSKIEVMGYLAYSTTLEDTSTGEECSIVRHEDCYSASCE